MLLIAALAVLGLGIAAALLGGGPEVDGWLRTVFGQVFAVVAAAMAAVLGLPAAAGLWAMAGAAAADAVPALGAMTRHTLVTIGIAVIAASVIAVVLDGTSSRLVNLGVVGLIALALFGLIGAVSFSPHRRRASIAAAALVAVALATAWLLVTIAF
jgi:hypothetical protein